MRDSVGTGGWLALLASVVAAGVVVYGASPFDPAVAVGVVLVVGVLVGGGYGLVRWDRGGVVVGSGVVLLLGGFGVAAATVYLFSSLGLWGIVGVLSMLGLASVWMNVLGGGGLDDFFDLLGKSVYVFLFLLLAATVWALLGGFSIFVGGWFGFAASSESRLLGAVLLEVMVSVYLVRRFERKLPVALFPDALRTDYLSRDRIAISYIFTFLFSLSLLASGFSGVLPSPAKVVVYGLHVAAFVVAAALAVVTVNVFFWRRTVGDRYSPLTQGLLLGAVAVGFAVVATPLDEVVVDAVWGASVSWWETASFFFLIGFVGTVVVFLLLLFVVLLLVFGGAPDGSGGVAAGSMLLFASALFAALGFGDPYLVFVGVGGSLLVWDVGENYTQAVRQLGGVREARGELVHFLGGSVVAGVGVIVASLGFVVARSVSLSVSSGSLLVALLLSLLGVLVLLLTLR